MGETGAFEEHSRAGDLIAPRQAHPRRPLASIFHDSFPPQALCGARTGQNGGMTAAVPDLSELRAGIDAVDAELVRILAERARLVEGVVRYKRANHMRVVDRSREELMLERIGQLATSEGLDSRVARQVLRTIIDSFTLLEVEELGPDA